MKYSSVIIVTLSVLLIASVSVITINADLENNEVLNPDRNSYKIPEWVKANANWWVNDHITDNEFSYSIEYLIDQNIIQVEKCEGEC